MRGCIIDQKVREERELWNNNAITILIGKAIQLDSGKINSTYVVT